MEKNLFDCENSPQANSDFSFNESNEIKCNDNQPQALPSSSNMVFPTTGPTSNLNVAFNEGINEPNQTFSEPCQGENIFELDNTNSIENMLIDDPYVDEAISMPTYNVVQTDPFTIENIPQSIGQYEQNSTSNRLNLSLSEDGANENYTNDSGDHMELNSSISNSQMNYEIMNFGKTITMIKSFLNKTVDCTIICKRFLVPRKEENKEQYIRMTIEQLLESKKHVKGPYPKIDNDSFLKYVHKKENEKEYTKKKKLAKLFINFTFLDCANIFMITGNNVENHINDVLKEKKFEDANLQKLFEENKNDLIKELVKFISKS